MPRDSSGNYTLPAGNPVVDGTIIDVNWANPTMQDVAVQMNNLITRNGLLSATAPIKFNDGTVGLPGITWASEPSSGLYRPSANVLGMSISGVQRQRWTTTGTAVTGTMDLSGPLNLTGTLTLTGGTVSVTGNSTFAGLMTVTGTLAVSGILGVTGLGETFRMTTTAARGSGNNYLTFADPSGNKANIGYGAGSDVLLIVQALTADMSFCTSNVERMRLDAGGNLGIGRTPGTKLDVAGNIRAIFTSTAYTAGLTLESSANNPGELSPAVTFSSSNPNAAIWSSRLVAFGGSLVFATQPTTGGNPVERMRITADGTTLVGSTTPGFAFANRQVFEINGASSALFGLKVGNNASAYFYSDGTDAYLWNAAVGKLSLGSNAAERLIIDSAGNVAIGGVAWTQANSSRNLQIRGNSATSSTMTVASADSGSSVMAWSGADSSDTPAFIFQKGLRFGRIATLGVISDFSEFMRFGGSNKYISIGITTLDSTFCVQLTSVAGLRVGYNNTSNNYYDADTHNFRNAANAATATLGSNGDWGVVGGLFARGGRTAAIDPGSDINAMPVGSIICAEIVNNGGGFNSTSYLNSFPMNTTDYIRMYAVNSGNSTTAIQYGTWRALGRVTTTSSIWVRVA